MLIHQLVVSTVLDLILSRNPDLVSNVSVTQAYNLGNSDHHHMVIFTAHQVCEYVDTRKPPQSQRL